MILKNIKVYTMDGDDRIIENGYIRFENGRIVETGSMSGIETSSEEAVDGGGSSAYPGFIDAHCHIGVFEDSLGFEGDDGNEENDPCTPNLRIIDSVNPMDKCFSEALAAGVTTAVTSPGSANPIGGQIAALKTYGRIVDDMIVKQPLAMKFALGENPKTVYNGKNRSPMTRMMTASIIRDTLEKAMRYGEKLAAGKEPEYNAKYEALLPVLRGRMNAHFHAHRCDDIFTALRIAEEFSLKCTIVHGTQGYLMADELAKRNVSVLSGPLLCDRSKPEMSSLTPASAGILVKAGVKTAIITDHPVIPIQYLPLCAGLAVREGMDRYEALKAITISAAQICGIGDRVGSIEPGKDADIVLFDGDPFEVMSKPRMVVCGGRLL